MKCILFLLLILILPTNYSKAQVENNQDTVLLNDLVNMSLEELLKLKITGAVVKDLGFDYILQTDNLVEASSINTPASIEIIESKTIIALGLKNIIEATENTAGIISGVSPAEPYAYSMRGFSRDYVKILYDGVSIGIATLNTRPLGTSNLEKIEIIKGPVTLSHGQGGAAGTINIISKQPKLSDYHTRHLDITYGQYNSSLINAEIEGPIGKYFAYRTDFNRNASDGWVDNSKSESMNFSTALLWEPIDQLKTIFSLVYSKDDLPGFWGTPLIPSSFANNPLNVVKTDNDLVIDGSIRNINYNVNDQTINSNSLKLMFDVNWNITKGISNKTKLYYYQADREWKNAENYNFDIVTMKIVRDRFSVNHDRALWGINSSFKFTGEFIGLKNVLGVHLEFNKNDFSRSVGFQNGIQDSVDLINPVPGEFGSVDERDDFFKEGIIALVIDNKIELTSKLSIEIAGRFERINIERERYNFDGTPRSNQSIDKYFFQGAYRVGTVYNILEKLFIYGHYSFQHGPFAGDIGTTALSDASTFIPSNIIQKEIGLKTSLFEKKMELTLALYDINRTIDIQLTPDQISENIQTSQGVEFAAKTEFLKNYKLGASFAYTYARFGEYYDASYDRDVTGNIPVNVPDIILNLWMSYINIANLPIEIGAGYKYISERQANTSNTITLSDYSLFNAFAAYTLLDKYRLAFHVRNITNEDYVPWSDIYYPNQFILGPPRTFELSFLAHF